MREIYSLARVLLTALAISVAFVTTVSFGLGPRLPTIEDRDGRSSAGKDRPSTMGRLGKPDPVRFAAASQPGMPEFADGRTVGPREAVRMYNGSVVTDLMYN